MVVTTYTLDLSDTISLNAFDDVTHMAFGDDNTIPNQSQTSLINEVSRNLLIEKIKNTTDNTYTLTGRIPITEFNSSTVYEIGVFNASTSGVMSVRLVLTTGLTKTSDDELIFRLKIITNTENT